MKRLFLLATIVVAAAGCMTSPHDQQSVANRNTELAFQGFYPADAEIRVLAENPANGAFDQLTTARPNMGTGFGPDNNFYRWTVRGTIPNQYWVPGFRGYRARVRSMAGNTHLMSVNSNWLTCYMQNGSDPVQFGNNCASDNSPIAEVFTDDYCAEEPTYLPDHAQHLGFINGDWQRFARLQVTVMTSHPDTATARVRGLGVGPNGFLFNRCERTAQGPQGDQYWVRFECRTAAGNHDGGRFNSDCDYLDWLRGNPLDVTTEDPLGGGSNCEQSSTHRETNMGRIWAPDHFVPSCTNPPPYDPPTPTPGPQTTIVAFCACDVNTSTGSSFVEHKYATTCTWDGHPAEEMATIACSQLAPSWVGQFHTTRCRPTVWIETNPNSCIFHP